MAEGATTATLTVRRGPRRGKKFVLTDAGFQIGHDSKCGLVVKDQYVSPVHTVIERRGSFWVASNQGMNGTLVNGAQIEGARTLAPGDVIQVGAETLIEFQVAESPSSKQKKKGRAEGEKRSLWKSPAVIGGLVLYLGIMTAGFVVMSGLGSSKGEAGLPSELAQRVSNGTRSFLLSDEALETGLGSSPAPDSAVDPAASYYALLAERRGDGTEVEELAARVVVAVERELFQAWHLEQQGRPSHAIERYQKLMQMIPTLRSPSTRLAAARIRVLERKIKDAR